MNSSRISFALTALTAAFGVGSLPAADLTSCANEFASSNLPPGWYVKQKTSGGKVSLTLAFAKGTTFLFR